MHFTLEEEEEWEWKHQQQHDEKGQDKVKEVVIYFVRTFSGNR